MPMTNAPDWARPGRVHRWTRGDRLRAAREHSEGQPTQAEFAKRIGFAKNTVARYERDAPGTNRPLVLVQWARATGFDYEWLVGGDDGKDGAHITPVTMRYRQFSAA